MRLQTDHTNTAQNINKAHSLNETLQRIWSKEQQREQQQQCLDLLSGICSQLPVLSVTCERRSLTLNKHDQTLTDDPHELMITLHRCCTDLFQTYVQTPHDVQMGTTNRVKKVTLDT